VKQQLKNAKPAKGDRGIKTIFLVGGLGSNQYLAEYLESKIGGGIDVQQPAQGVSAIARGAVLYKLGLNLVKEHVMRVHYGVATWVPFKSDHPKRLRIDCLDGSIMCKDVMMWYAKKSDRMPHDRSVESTFKNDEFTEESFRKQTFLRGITLYACADSTAPIYKEPSVHKICTISVDLKKIPRRAFELRSGPQGAYYHVEYQLEVKFGPVLEFKFKWDGKVIGKAKAKYS